MLDRLAFKILISFYEINFFSHLWHAIKHFRKISKFWKLAYLRIFWAQRHCSEIQNFSFSTKNYIETEKYTQASWLKTLHQNFGNNDPTKDIEIAVSLQFCRVLEIPLINFEVFLTLRWSDNCALTNNANREEANWSCCWFCSSWINNPTNATFKM